MWFGIFSSYSTTYDPYGGSLLKSTTMLFPSWILFGGKETFYNPIFTTNTRI